MDQPNRSLLTKENIESEWKEFCDCVGERDKGKADELRKQARESTAAAIWQNHRKILQRAEDQKVLPRTSEGLLLKEPDMYGVEWDTLKYERWVNLVNRANPESKDKMGASDYDKLLGRLEERIRERSKKKNGARTEKVVKRLRKESARYWSRRDGSE
jgi:hypothetical protein